MVEKYLESYCKKEHVDKDTAKTHAIVKSVMEYYDHVNDGRISVKETSGNSAEIGECK